MTCCNLIKSIIDLGIPTLAYRIDQLDLRSLRVLSALAHTRNTYRAAEQLHLSQSAVSRALARLRDLLQDPLFVRSAAGMEPTEKAEQIVARLPELLDMLEDVIEGDQSFDPSDWQGEVRIALSSLSMMTWGSEIGDTLAHLAPRVTWQLQTWGPSTLTDILDGRVLLGVHYRNDRWPQDLLQETIAQEEYVLMAREGHEALGREATPNLFRNHSLISLLLPEYNDYDNRLEAALRALGIEPRVRLRTDSLALAMERLRSSDWLMAGTRSMSGKTEGLQMLPYSREFTLPDTSVVLCYPRRIRNSPRMNWLAGQIRGIVESARGGSPEPQH